MKKVFALLAIGGLFMATSCKGDYNCDCTYSTGGTSTVISYSGVTKSDAKEGCDAWFSSWIQPVDPGASCAVVKQ